MALAVAAPAELAGLAELQGLRQRARSDDSAALGEVAVQFEALVYGIMLESARASLSDEGLMGGETQHYLELMDRQVALALARQGGLGLGKLLGADPVEASRASDRPVRAAVDHEAFVRRIAPHAAVDHQAFVRQIALHAQAAGRALGVDPKLLVAQAALESGWGGKAIARGDGRPAFNLFGIKTGSGWTGDTVTRRTIEYVDGIAQRRRESFRAYPDLGAGFRDYVELIRESDRFSAAAEPVDADSYVGALADGGYATDPHYGEKWLAIYRGERLQRAYADSL